MGGVLDGHLSFTRVGDHEYFPPDQSWTPLNNERFVPVEMPKEIGGLWQQRLFTASPEELQQFVPDLRINDDSLVKHIPDISVWPPFALVSDTAKDALESIDKDGHYFVPISIFTQQEHLVGERFWAWIPRHKFYFDPPKNARKASLPFPGQFSDPRLAFELQTNSALRNYLKNIPVWALRGFLEACFSSEAFQALRTLRLTGLVENTNPRYAADRKQHESIGHIE